MSVLERISALIKDAPVIFRILYALLIMIGPVALRIAEMRREKELFPAWCKKFFGTMALCLIVAIPANAPSGPFLTVESLRMAFFIFRKRRRRYE